MSRTYLAIGVTMLLISGSLGLAYLFQPTQAESLNIDTSCEGIVEKRVGEVFTIKVVFKNKGTGDGSWRVSVAFENEDWTWKGEEQPLSLESQARETLSWEGTVPDTAAVDSLARLIVYYDNDFMRQNWWIHVTPSPELAILHSQVW
jgi:hypothetical protein